jgi:hypothetical protein
MDELLQEDRIEQLMQEVEQLGGKFIEPGAAGDLDAVRPIIVRMAEIERDLKAIQSSQMATLTGLIDDRPRGDPGGEAERIARLLRAFEFSARLKKIASDVICDSDIQDQWVDQSNKIVTVLDAVDPGRQHLIGLLDHPIPDVRASAGAYVMEVAPERALPVLRAVYESERGFSAGWTAFWPLEMYDVERKKKEQKDKGT